MDSLVEFIADNYIWIIGVCIVIILSLIGYFAEKNNLLKLNKNEEKVTSTQEMTLNNNDFVENESLDTNFENENANIISDETPTFENEEITGVQPIEESFSSEVESEVVPFDETPVFENEETTSDQPIEEPFASEAESEVVPFNETPTFENEEITGVQPIEEPFSSEVESEVVPFNETPTFENEETINDNLNDDQIFISDNEESINDFDKTIQEIDNKDNTEYDQLTDEEISSNDNEISSNSIDDNQIFISDEKSSIDESKQEVNNEEKSEQPKLTDEEILSQTKDLDEIKEELNKIVFETNLDEKYLKDIVYDDKELSDIDIKLPDIELLQSKNDKD